MSFIKTHKINESRTTGFLKLQVAKRNIRILVYCHNNKNPLLLRLVFWLCTIFFSQQLFILVRIFFLILIIMLKYINSIELWQFTNKHLVINDFNKRLTTRTANITNRTRYEKQQCQLVSFIIKCLLTYIITTHLVFNNIYSQT